jgi:hypothetical protein
MKTLQITDELANAAADYLSYMESEVERLAAVGITEPDHSKFERLLMRDIVASAASTPTAETSAQPKCVHCQGTSLDSGRCVGLCNGEPCKVETSAQPKCDHPPHMRMGSADNLGHVRDECSKCGHVFYDGTMSAEKDIALRDGIASATTAPPVDLGSFAKYADDDKGSAQPEAPKLRRLERATGVRACDALRMARQFILQEARADFADESAAKDKRIAELQQRNDYHYDRMAKWQRWAANKLTVLGLQLDGGRYGDDKAREILGERLLSSVGKCEALTLDEKLAIVAEVEENADRLLDVVSLAAEAQRKKCGQ